MTVQIINDWTWKTCISQTNEIKKLEPKKRIKRKGKISMPAYELFPEVIPIPAYKSIPEVIVQQGSDIPPHQSTTDFQPRLNPRFQSSSTQLIPDLQKIRDKPRSQQTRQIPTDMPRFEQTRQTYTRYSPNSFFPGLKLLIMK